MRERRVVVTGLGIVNPSGIGKDTFWENITHGKVAINRITRFDSSNYPIKVASEIASFDPEEYVPKRMLIKTDRFAHYALAAAEMALNDSGIKITQDNEYLSGIFFGNNSGGWDICERGFREMYKDGPSLVNPWQATAWFPTAPQGYIAIKYGIKGLSKTFVADRISGSSALYFAVFSILMGDNNITIAGGTEAPLSPFGIICYHESGEMSVSSDPSKACRPFARNPSGIVLGEGSAVMVLEELEHALKRQARIYGEITGWAMTVGKPDEVESMETCMKSAISKSGLGLNDIDLLVPEGNGARISDYVEKTALNNLWRGSSRKLPVITPKALFGHLYGASTATDVACGLLAMKTGCLPLCQNFADDEPECFEVMNTNKAPIPIDNVLVNSRSREGVNVSLVLSRYH